MEIIHLKREEINDNQWNKCIKESFNGIVYGYTWYLDLVCEHWEALVDQHYETVMPITFKKKFGIPYLFQPLFTQQLGVFSQNLLNEQIVEKYIAAIPSRYKFIEINLNSFNKISDNSTIHRKYRTTYQLDLIGDYTSLYKNYATNTKRNLKKALAKQITIVENLSPNELLKLKRENQRVPLTEDNLSLLMRIVTNAVRFKIANIYGAYNSENTLCAACCFITSHNKTIMLLAVSNEEGKMNGAMSQIINTHIKHNVEKSLILDFEGSDIPGLARFYSGFGAIPCKYMQIKINRLPWLVKWLKR